MKTQLPEHPTSFARKHPEVWAAFEKLADRCHNGGPLDAKTRRLVKLGIALGAGREGGVHAQVRNAVAEGIKPAELHHVVLLALTTLGFPGTMAALAWVEDVLQRKGRRGRRRRA